MVVVQRLTVFVTRHQVHREQLVLLEGRLPDGGGKAGERRVRRRHVGAAEVAAGEVVRLGRRPARREVEPQLGDAAGDDGDVVGDGGDRLAGAVAGLHDDGDVAAATVVELERERLIGRQAERSAVRDDDVGVLAVVGRRHRQRRHRQRRRAGEGDFDEGAGVATGERQQQ